MFYCKERVRLVKVWRDAVAVFSDATEQLEECKSDRPRFEERYKAAMLARELAEGGSRQYGGPIAHAMDVSGEKAGSESGVDALNNAAHLTMARWPPGAQMIPHGARRRTVQYR
jgi:hypothetical protein